MQKNKIDNIPTLVEYSPGKDPFAKSHQKGSRSWILKHMFHGSNKILLIIVFFTTVLSANLNSITYIVLGNALVDFISPTPTNTLLFYVILILLLNLGTPILRIISFMLREVVAHRMERDTRREFYTNLLGKSQSFHEQQQIGDLMARVTNDVRMLQFLLSPAISYIFESFTTLVIPVIYIIIFYPPQLIFAPILFTVLFLISLKSYVHKLGPVTLRLRMFFGMMNATLAETLNGIEVVKATVQERKELKKYSSNATSYRDAYLDQGKIQARYLPLLLIALTVTIGLTHGITLLFILPSSVFRIGDLIGYLGLVGQLRFPTMISMMVFGTLRASISSSHRLLELMNRKTEIDENVEGAKKVIDGKIRFENVSFIYPGSDRPVLKDITFEVQPGQTVAIVGTTGSGKTTLTKLMSRLYDVNQGRIMIDDIDIKDYSLKSLRSQISYIEQDIFLFSDSLFNNISFGRTSSMEDIIRCAKEAQADNFIRKLPNQYDSEIGERGVQLSGGERQRIAIARAFLSDPRILILDDSTSSIDSNTEDKIQQAIKNILRKRTTLLITHRLSQIRWADLIIVLKSGEIVNMGTHEDLLRISEEYRKIFIKKFDVDVEQLLKKKEVS